MTGCAFGTNYPLLITPWNTGAIGDEGICVGGDQGAHGGGDEVESLTKTSKFNLQTSGKHRASTDRDSAD